MYVNPQLLRRRPRGIESLYYMWCGCLELASHIYIYSHVRIFWELGNNSVHESRLLRRWDNSQFDPQQSRIVCAVGSARRWATHLELRRQKKLLHFECHVGAWVFSFFLSVKLSVSDVRKLLWALPWRVQIFYRLLCNSIHTHIYLIYTHIYIYVYTYTVKAAESFKGPRYDKSSIGVSVFSEALESLCSRDKRQALAPLLPEPITSGPINVDLETSLYQQQQQQQQDGPLLLLFFLPLTSLWHEAHGLG